TTSTDTRDADIVVTKVNSAGTAIVYRDVFGGSDGDVGTAIAVDGSGNAYIAGYSFSDNYPTVNPFQSTNKGAANGGSAANAVVTKLNSTGTIVYSTYLGGTRNDVAKRFDIGSSGI